MVIVWYVCADCGKVVDRPYGKGPVVRESECRGWRCGPCLQVRYAKDLD